jgi:anti-sigma regulatory factor (Ser/Thr protein kinase)
MPQQNASGTITGPQDISAGQAPGDSGTMSMTYCGTPASVSAARHRVRTTLRRSPRVDDAELIVAELMNNAIRHTPSGVAGGTFTLTVRQRPGWARIEVGDQGEARLLPAGAGGPLVPRPPPGVPPGGGPPDAAIAEGGRGLAIVAALADECGHEANAGRTRTSWAVLVWLERA